MTAQESILNIWLEAVHDFVDEHASLKPVLQATLTAAIILIFSDASASNGASDTAELKCLALSLALETAESAYKISLINHKRVDISFAEKALLGADKVVYVFTDIAGSLTDRCTALHLIDAKSSHKLINGIVARLNARKRDLKL